MFSVKPFSVFEPSFEHFLYETNLKKFFRLHYLVLFVVCVRVAFGSSGSWKCKFLKWMRLEWASTISDPWFNRQSYNFFVIQDWHRLDVATVFWSFSGLSVRIATWCRLGIVCFWILHLFSRFYSKPKSWLWAKNLEQPIENYRPDCF